MKTFDTYIQKQQIITPDQKVYQMFERVNNDSWKFKGLVSESAKNIIQSDDTINDLNSRYKDQELLATFTKKPVEETKKSFLFLPCPEAYVSIFQPQYKDE